MNISSSISDSYGIRSFNYSPESVSCSRKDGCSTESTGQSESADSSGKPELTEEENREVQKLQSRDQEVRAHEMAHVAAGGQYVRGGASFEYQTGPDGKRYAVGGEVSIDSSAVNGDPQATIQKMQAVKRAALAPASPSSQDRSVASDAAQKEMKAREQLREEQSPEKSSPASPETKRKNTTYTKEGISPAAPSNTTPQHFDLIA